MKKVKSLVFHRLVSPNTVDFRDHLTSIISNFEFNEQLGYGLSFVDTYDDVLTIKVVKRTSTFINDFNSSENQFVRRKIDVFSEFQFSIDFNINILYVNGGISHSNCVKYLFRSILDIQYELDPVNLNASTFYKLLVEQGVNAKIDHITINHFNLNNEIIGRFSGSVLNNTIGPELVESYKSDIVKLSFLININENESFILQIFPNGALKFLSDPEDFDFILDYLKQLIFSNNG